MIGKRTATKPFEGNQVRASLFQKLTSSVSATVKEGSEKAIAHHRKPRDWLHDGKVELTPAELQYLRANPDIAYSVVGACNRELPRGQKIDSLSLDGSSFEADLKRPSNLVRNAGMLSCMTGVVAVPAGLIVSIAGVIIGQPTMELGGAIAFAAGGAGFCVGGPIGTMGSNKGDWMDRQSQFKSEFEAP